MMFSNIIHEKIERYNAFYRSPKGGVMTLVSVESEAEIPGYIPLNEIDWEDETSIRFFASTYMEAFRKQMQNTDKIDDDMIPIVQVLAGTGLVAAAFVKEAAVHHERDTNYLEQVVKDWQDGIDMIGFFPENKYFQAQMQILKYFLEQWDGTYTIIPFTHFDPLDLAFQFRGSEIMLDFHLEPDNLHKLLQRCTDSIMKLEDYLRSTYLKGHSLENGVGVGCWCPRGNYLSCDLGDLISPQLLNEFGRPYFDKIVDRWGGAFLHHHELGTHQIETWSGCKDLTVQFLNRDPNTAHLADNINNDIIASTFNTPIYFICTYAEFMAESKRWAQGKFIVLVICKDKRQAEDVVRLTKMLRNF